MNKIIEAQNLPENEKIYLKKDLLGWRVVNPIKNDDGTYNWSNLIFGGKRNFFNLIILLLMLIILMWSHYHDVNAIQENYGRIAMDPVGWCKDVNKGNIELPDQFRLNITKLNFTE